VGITHIHTVLNPRSHADGDWLLDSNIETPTVNLRSDVYQLELAGWAVGRSSRVLALEVYYGSYCLTSTPVDRDRPDLVTAFPGIDWAHEAGFRTTVNLLGVVGEFELRLSLLLEGGARSPLGQLRGRRENLPAPQPGEPTPLLVATHGRSGSSYLMRLLACMT